MKNFNLNTLYKIIKNRIQNKSENSYSYKLYKNPGLLNKKILEETNEFISTKNKRQVVWEASDLLYFVLVFLVKRKVNLSEIEKKLMERNKNNKKLNYYKKKEAKMKFDKINILFVCKYNRFRSRIAEAYFKKVNKNKKIKVKSAGLIKGNQLDKNQIKLAKKFKLDIKGKPKGLSTNLLKEQDLVIVVADDVPKEVFDKNYTKKLIVWKIPDNLKTEEATINKIIKPIMKKVEQLNKILNKKEK